MIPIGTANELNHNMENIMNNIHMNQLCKVCNEPAAGFHFGAFTCEGCKSFFGRTYNNVSGVSECKNGGRCEITKKNRTSCKSCRLRKCLQVGMSKSGSRYGRRSNWFKIHCLLSAQSQSNGMSSAASNTSSASSPPETNNNKSSLLNNNNNSSNNSNHNNSNNSRSSNNNNISQSNSNKVPSAATITSQGGQPTDIDREMMLRNSSSRHSLHNNHHSHSHHRHSSRERTSSSSSSMSNNNSNTHQQEISSHRMGSNNNPRLQHLPHHPPFPNHLPPSLSPNSKESFLASFGHIPKGNPGGGAPTPDMYEYFRMAALAAQAAAAANGGLGANNNNNTKPFFAPDHDSRDRDDDARPLTTRSPGSLESPNSDAGSITDEIHKSSTPGSLFSGILPPGSPHELKPNDILSFDLLTRDLMKLGYDPLRLWPAMLSASANLPPNSLHQQHLQQQFNPYRFMLPNFPAPGAPAGFPAHMLHSNPLLTNPLQSSVVIPQPNIPPTSTNPLIPNGSIGQSAKLCNSSTPPCERESPQNHHHSGHHNRRFPAIPTPLSGGSSSLTLTPPISHHGSEDLMVPKYTSSHKSHKYAGRTPPSAIIMDDGPIDLSAKPNNSSSSGRIACGDINEQYREREKRKSQPHHYQSHSHRAESLVKSEIHSSDNDNNSSDVDDQLENEQDEEEEEVINFQKHNNKSHRSVSRSSAASSVSRNSYSSSPLPKKETKSDLSENQKSDDEEEEQITNSAAAAKSRRRQSANELDFNNDKDDEVINKNPLPHDLSRNSSPHHNNNNNTIIKSECVNLAITKNPEHIMNNSTHNRKRNRHISGSSVDSLSGSSTHSGHHSLDESNKKAKIGTTTISAALDLTRPLSNSSSASSCASVPSRSISNSNPPPKISI